MNSTPPSIDHYLQEGAPDPAVERNRQLLLERSKVGLKKYGCTLQGIASHKAILQHALEEALDLANYLQEELMRIEAEEAAEGERKRMACTHRHSKWNLFLTRGICQNCGATLVAGANGIAVAETL